MAAGEQKLQAFVLEHRVVDLHLGLQRDVEQLRLLGERPLPADAVDRAIPGGRHEPRPRVDRGPVARPARRGDRERLLRGLLGEVEVAEEADQAREDASPLLAE